MEELRCMDNTKWIWIAVAALLLSGSFGAGDNCGTGIGGFGGSGGSGGIGNFFTDLKCGNNSWIWILALVFLFSGKF